MSELYIVATPIGNLSDMTFRAVDTLKNVHFVAAEDTRQSKKLFTRYDITTPLISYHAQSSESKTQDILSRLIKGERGALISDAGTPCISDPGFRLVRAAAKEGITIIPIPGASAMTTLLSASGFPTDTFTFHGFLPHKKGRQTLLKQFSEASHTQIVYESVHRFPKLLNELAEYTEPTRSICVGRELTKQFEEIWRGTVAQALEHFNDQNTRGEFVVMIAPPKFQW